MSPRTRLERFTFGSLGLVCAALGCGGIDAPVSLDSDQAAIVNGEVSDPSDDAVVQISRPGGSSCTGSLIAPNVVLTALHCVTDFKTDSGFVCNPDGTIVAGSSTDGKFGATLDPTLFEVRVGVDYHKDPDAHGSKIVGTGSTNICSNDIALVVIDTNLDAPLMPLRFGKSIQRAEQVRAVGYGQTEVNGSSGRFVRHNMLVLDVGSDLLSPGSNTAAPRTFVVGEGPCHGDSGGPARSEATNAALGVYSILNASSCTSPGAHNVYTQVSPFESLIRKVLSDEGYDPVLESDGDATGGGAGAGPGEAGGAAGDAGASSDPKMNTTGGSGGSSASAGSGGSVATGGTGGTSEETGAAPNGSQGSGSRRDPSCACRTGPEPANRAPLGMLGGLLATLGLALRRRQRN